MFLYVCVCVWGGGVCACVNVTKRGHTHDIRLVNKKVSGMDRGLKSCCSQSSDHYNTQRRYGSIENIHAWKLCIVVYTSSAAVIFGLAQFKRVYMYVLCICVPNTHSLTHTHTHTHTQWMQITHASVSPLRKKKVHRNCPQLNGRLSYTNHKLWSHFQ